MTITFHDNGVINPIEEVILNFTNSLFSFIRPVRWVPFLISWALGLIFLITVGSMYTIVFYVPFLIARKLTKKEVKSIIANIDELPQRQAMELHARIEYLKFKIASFLSKGRPFYVFLPLMHEAKKTMIQLKKAETALHSKAYPNSKELTEEQGKELIGIFSKWSDDWDVNDMNIYND